MLSQVKKLSKEKKIQTNNTDCFPKTHNKNLKWVPIFYFKRPQDTSFIPFIVEIPSEYKIPINLPFFSIPIWNQNTKRFKRGIFKMRHYHCECKESKRHQKKGEMKAPKKVKCTASLYNKSSYGKNLKFKDCDEGIELMTTNPSEELK